MPLKLNSTGGGSVTLDTPSTASAYTLTVPAITGTAVVTGSTNTVSTGMITNASVTQAKLAAGVAGNGPTVYAYQSSGQTFSAGTFTKVLYQSENWDTDNCYASSRFTPTVAGYYQVSAGVLLQAAASTETIIAVYINGGFLSYLCDIWHAAMRGAYGSGMVYCNGTTDYVEIYYYSGAGGTALAGVGYTYFQACLVRAA